MNHKVALVVGGTSGLGLELARLLSQEYELWIAGRNPSRKIINAQFQSIDLTAPTVSSDMDCMLATMPPIGILVYAAGFYQEGGLEELEDADIDCILKVGLQAPAFLIQRILKKQGWLDGLIVITSTSQWTPRPLEPVYTAVKAGLGMLVHSVSLSDRVGKVLVVGPAGMKTPFWDGTSKDQTNMLDPAWVAKQTFDLFQANFAYKFARILRGPARIEVVEERL